MVKSYMGILSCFYGYTALLLCLCFDLFSGQCFSELKQELLAMSEREQYLRMQWMDASDPDAEEVLRQQVIDMDDLHLPKLKQVIQEHGWPGHSLVGPEAAHAFWLLVQHTPDDAFQSQCLDLLEQAVADQEASAIDLAYLKDRVYMHAGKKQIYGTQLYEDLTFYPIEDEEHVNQRRLAIGLSSLEEYLETIKQVYKPVRP